MTKLAVFACVLLLACTSQAFTFSRLHMATDKTQNDVTSLNDTLTRIQEGVQESLNKLQTLANDSNTAVDSATQDTDVSEASDEEVADSADPSASQVSVDEVANAAEPSVSEDPQASEVSENTGDTNEEEIISTAKKLVTLLEGTSKSKSNDASEKSEASANSETEVVDVADPSDTEDTEASEISDDEVANAVEPSVSEDPQASEVSENTGDTNDEEIISTEKKLVTLLEGTLKSKSSDASEDSEVSADSENWDETSN